MCVFLFSAFFPISYIYFFIFFFSISHKKRKIEKQIVNSLILNVMTWCRILCTILHYTPNLLTINVFPRAFLPNMRFVQQLCNKQLTVNQYFTLYAFKNPDIFTPKDQ